MNFIVKKSFNFLTFREIWKISYINKHIYHYFINSDAILKLLENHIHQKVSQGNYKEIVYKLTGIKINSTSQIPKLFKFATNLIKNPYGKYGFNDWIKVDGGNGWAIENGNTYNNLPSCFVSSYQ